MRTALATAFAVLMTAVTAQGERLPVRLFTSADGLATDRVAAVLRDSHGFLWFGTGGGLSRFDGRNFQTFGPAEGLTNPYVNHILEERPGRYWVATNGGGLFLFTPRAGGAPDGAPRFVRAAIGATSAADRVNVVARDSSGRLWVGTDDGLFLVESTEPLARARRIEPGGLPLSAPLVQVWSLLPQTDGVVWAGTSVGLFAVLPDGRTLHRSIRPLQGADHVFALLTQPTGDVLVGHDSGLFLARVHGTGNATRDVELLQPFKPPDGPPPSVRALLRASDGTVWVLGRHGLGTLDGDRQRMVIDNRELEGGFRAIAEDAAGSLWVSRIAGGVVRLSRAGVIAYDARDGLGEAPYGRIFVSASGELCVAGRRDISVFDGRSFTRVRPRLPPDVLGIGRGSYGAVLEDHLGDWWIPGGDRLYRLPKVSRVSELAVTPPKAVYTTRDGLVGGDISRIFEDSRGDIWLNVRIPGRDVVTRWDRASGTFHRYGESHGLRPYNAVSGFAEDRSGAVWLSFLEGGLARYRRGTFEWVPGFDTMGGGTGPLHVDRQGRLWVSGFQGVRRIDTPLTQAPADVRSVILTGLERTRVRAFLEDEQGHLYLNADEGLVRWNIETERPLRLPTLGAAARLEAWAATRDRQGGLWFASASAVTRFMPQDIATAAPVTLRIGSVRVNGRPLPIDDLGQTEIPFVTLAPDERRIEIGFFALGRQEEDDIRFQYRLDGGDSAWSIPSPAASVDFAHLAPGTYHFEVKPVGADGSAAGSSAGVAFRIPPPLWARWWFLALVGVAGTGVGVSFHRRRLARAVELERIRTGIASDLHDDIGANLSQISLLSEVLHGKGIDADPADAATLGSIADLSRESVDAMGDIVWAIDPHKDHLTSLTSRMRRFASELLATRNIAFDIRLEGVEDIAIGADIRRHLYLVFKEALNNVVRHSGASRAEIDLRLTASDLELTVTDDGRGFDPSELTDGHGLRSLRARGSKTGGTLDIRSAPGRGTTVVLRVPVRRTHLIR